MKEIGDYNWDDLYRQTSEWMECERIPGKVNTGCKSMCNGHPKVDIKIPCLGNKVIIDRVCNYRFASKGRCYISNGRRWMSVYVKFSEDGVLGGLSHEIN